MKDGALYQIKVTLNGIHPPVWRRLLVPASCTMDALHCALQIAMGWMDGHLYAFKAENRLIEIPDPDAIDDGLNMGRSGRPRPEDAARVRLSEVARAGEKILYDYDFGDNWEHAILIEKAAAADDISARKAVCLKGRRACPPEDCGGIGGYEDFLEAVQNPGHPRHDELLEWIGGEWDAEAFDLEATNAALASWRPSQRSFMYEANWGEG